MSYNIFMDYEDDVLEIVKVPSKAPVKDTEGKYGIVISQDISGNTVKISIPEPEILFGVPIECIESFLISNTLYEV